MIKMKQKQILIITLLALLLLAVMPVQATTITMSNPDATHYFGMDGGIDDLA